MALVLKLAVAAALATAAVWTTATRPVSPAPAAPSAAALWPGAASWSAGVADTLTVGEKAGQLVVARLAEGGAAPAGVGGVVVSGGPLDAHLGRLRRLQEAAPLPLLVLTDGADRVGLPLEGTPQFPRPLAFGAAGRADLVYLAARATAEAARAVGVQSPGSPLRVGASPFGDPSESRAALDAALVRGLRDGGALPAAALDAEADVREAGPLVRAGLMEIRLRARAAETAGAVAARVRAVRAESGFNGLLVLDLESGAPAETAVAAVEAGADAVLTGAPRETARALEAAARAGRLGPRLDESVRRVLAAKAWAGLAAAPERGAARDGTGAKALRLSLWRPPSAALLHRAALLRQEVARRAVTVVQDEGGPLPIVGSGAPARVLAVLLDADSTRLAPFAEHVAAGLDAGVAFTAARLGPDVGDARFARVLAVAGRADLVVLVAADDLDARQRAVAERALASGPPVALVALGAPGLAEGLSRPAALVAAYGADRAAQRAAAEAVAGQVAVGGRLPVAVAGLWAAGSGRRLRQQALRPGTAEEAGLDEATAERVDAVVRRAVRDGAFPGAAVAVGRDGVLVRLRGYGALTPGGAPATETTAYDLASLTKVVGTTAAVMRLVEAGEISLDAPVRTYLPDYRPVGGTPTVRQLLSHSAGHRPFYPFYARGVLDREGVLAFVYADTLSYRPGARSRYSDFDMIVLGEVIEAVTGRPLDEALREMVFRPLGMRHTGFRQPGALDPTAAPTERDGVWRGRTLQGEVHDEAASVMGGVAGHAGLFSTAEDLARFAFALASGGEAYGARLFRPSTLDRFTERVRLESTYPTGLGWMLQETGRARSSAGSVFGPRSFGHTGFTGTSIWVDPDQGLFVVLLSNRVHPTRRNRKIGAVRSDLADAVAGSVRAPSGEAVESWGFGPVPDDLAAAR